MKTIGVVTPGGDAPGMNAAIRAVTRIAHSRNLQVLGFERGWDGLLTNTYKRLTPRTVGGTTSAAVLWMKFVASPRATPGLRLKKSVILVN